ncbi:GNAT family N-acetyltransferase [uncultured Friedmanniella sp.]|uniref:GNAT family N-acetyltransferase n=1 Tax=uncultured Friedmanniella sp. TaxID=335381 RepID=UPI0035CC5356
MRNLHPHDRLRSARPGERWVVRHRLPDGSATDAVGWVDLLADTHLHLSTAGDGHRVVVERADVLAARRVTVAPGGPPVARVSPEELERLALPGWLALHDPLGEWTLRSGGGFTGRANSCLAVGDPGMPVAEAARRIEAYAALNAIPARAQVVQGGEPEAELRALGWAEDYVDTDVLALRLADLLGRDPPPPGVRLTEDLEVAWWHAYGESRPGALDQSGAPDPGLLRLILAGHPPRAFASVPGPDGTPQAIARGHLSGDWLGYAAIWTRPEHRQQGRASRMMAVLGHWAARRGARYAYLQVATANGAARSAYERMGFTLHHRYRYLAPASARTVVTSEA